MKISNQKDLWGGVIFASIGFAFLIIAYGVKFGDTVLLPGYSMGTPARMGPAFFPFWLGLILTTLGVGISVAALRSREQKPLERFYWGAIGWVLGAVCVFGFLMKPIACRSRASRSSSSRASAATTSSGSTCCGSRSGWWSSARWYSSMG
jgi:hypothetical protein